MYSASVVKSGAMKMHVSHSISSFKSYAFAFASHGLKYIFVKKLVAAVTVSIELSVHS